jgi:hypothetical protein
MIDFGSLFLKRAVCEIINQELGTVISMQNFDCSRDDRPDIAESK